MYEMVGGWLRGGKGSYVEGNQILVRDEYERKREGRLEEEEQTKDERRKQVQCRKGTP